MNADKFSEMALDSDWPEERIVAWIFCNSAFDTPFPDESWSDDEIEAISNRTLEVYESRTSRSRHHSSQHRSSGGGFLDGFAEGITEIAGHVCTHALKMYFGKHR
ncbi:MAG: hypothetical protein AAGA30_10160 [Planctomycetota bacterium]